MELAELPLLLDSAEGGHLLAASGLEGTTDVAHDLILRWDGAGFIVGSTGARLHLPGWRPERGSHEVLGDATGATLAVILRKNMVGCALPAGAAAELLSGGGQVVSSVAAEDGMLATLLLADGWTLALHRRADRCGLGFDEDGEAAAHLAERAATADLVRVAAERLRSHGALPCLQDPGAAARLAAAWSVLRAHIHSPQAGHDCRWLAARRGEPAPAAAADAALASVALNQQDRYAAWDVLRDALRQPPAPGPELLAAAVLENFKDTGDSDALRWALPLLEQRLGATQAVEPALLALDYGSLATLAHCLDDAARRQQWQQVAAALPVAEWDEALLARHPQAAPWAVRAWRKQGQAARATAMVQFLTNQAPRDLRQAALALALLPTEPAP